MNKFRSWLKERARPILILAVISSCLPAIFMALNLEHFHETLATVLTSSDLPGVTKLVVKCRHLLLAFSILLPVCALTPLIARQRPAINYTVALITLSVLECFLLVIGIAMPWILFPIK